MDMIDILGEQSLAHARTILETQGRIRYLKDWDTEISNRVKTAVIVPGSEPVIERFSPSAQRTIPYRLTVSRVTAARSRRFDYAKLKARESGLYHRYVSVSAADSPLTLTFPRAVVWNGLRSVGWQAAREEFEDVKARSTASLRHEAETLSNVRGELRDLASREKVERIALAELITTKDRAIRPYTHENGIPRVSESGIRQSIDLDFAAAHPLLRNYVTHADVKPYTKVWFQRIDDDEEL